MDETQQVPNQNPITPPVPPTVTYPMAQPVTVSKTPWLVIVLMILLAGIANFFGYQNYQLKQQLSYQTSPSPSPIISPTPKASTTSTTNSSLFQIKELGLTFQLPTKLLQLGNWETITLPSDTGSNICFHLVPSTSWLVGSVKAGGLGICSGKYLTINSVSSDFTAGRGGSFTDISGYRTKGGEYYLGLHNSEGERPLDTNSPQEITTSNGIKYLLIKGEDVDNPGQLLSSEYIGAIINTGNSKYPGIVIAMQLSDQLSLDDFKQILATFKLAE